MHNKAHNNYLQTMIFDNSSIKAIHESPYKFVISSSGGGTNAISALMGVPGASQSILESYVPYSRESLDIHLNKTPDHYCSQATSLHMASLAYKKALKISNIDKKYLFGIAVTASLRSNYNKLGEHRFHIALQNQKQTVVINCVLKKNKRSREEEENLLSTFILNLISKSCALDFGYPQVSDDIEIIEVQGKNDWIDLIDDKVGFISNTTNKPELIFPGSFNPLHKGHLKMKKVAERKTGMDLYYEICIDNVDKPPLTFFEISNTINQFENDSWVLTKAGRFIDKAKLFENATFVIGYDTLRRLFNEKYYENSKIMKENLMIFDDFNINFLVFGRKDFDKFKSLEDVDIPAELKPRFTGFDENTFRDDISSSEIRKKELD